MSQAGNTLSQIAEAWTGQLFGQLSEPLRADQVRTMLREVVRIAPPLSRRRVAWTDPMDRDLVRMKLDRSTGKEISLRLGVSVSSVDSRIWKLKQEGRYDRLVAEIEAEGKADVRRRLVAALRARAASLGEAEPQPAAPPPFTPTWTDERDETLVRLKAGGVRRVEIAERLDSTVRAIDKRWHILRAQPRWSALCREVRGFDPRIPDHLKQRAGKPRKPARQASDKTMRPCLKCRKPFRSEGIRNRVCDPCKHTADWQSGIDLQVSEGVPV